MYYRVFIAFGRVDTPMLKCIEYVCDVRKKLESEAPASSRGDEKSRFSERTQARRDGLPIPPVKWVTRKHSEAWNARQDAKFWENPMPRRSAGGRNTKQVT